MRDDVVQGLQAELAALLRSDWKLIIGRDSIRVVGSAADFVDEVWRIGRGIAYGEFVSIERVGVAPLVYELTSRSGELEFVVVVVVECLRDSLAKDGVE